MPLKTWDTKAEWDANYRIGAEGATGRTRHGPEVKLNYARSVVMPYCQARAEGMPTLFGWSAPGPTIVIVGAAFGWTVEALEALGYTSVVGTDISTYVHTEKAATEEADIEAAITVAGLDPSTGEGAALKARFFDGGNRTRTSRSVLDEDGTTNTSRKNIKSALGLGNGDTIDWAITEGVLSSLSDLEAQALSEDAHLYAANIAHFVHTPSAIGVNKPGFSWKTLAEWKVLIPADIFVDIGTYETV